MGMPPLGAAPDERAGSARISLVISPGSDEPGLFFDEDGSSPRPALRGVSSDSVVGRGNQVGEALWRGPI